MSERKPSKKGNPMDGLITVSDCAVRKSVSVQAVNDAIKRGAIAAQKVGPLWLMTEEACEAYQPAKTPSERGARNAGRPKKKAPALAAEEAEGRS
jgi:hypothetical protein